MFFNFSGPQCPYWVFQHQSLVFSSPAGSWTRVSTLKGSRREPFAYGTKSSLSSELIVRISYRQFLLSVAVYAGIEPAISCVTGRRNSRYSNTPNKQTSFQTERPILDLNVRTYPRVSFRARNSQGLRSYGKDRNWTCKTRYEWQIYSLRSPPHCSTFPKSNHTIKNQYSLLQFVSWWPCSSHIYNLVSSNVTIK